MAESEEVAQLKHKIHRQLSFYFSDSNLRKDKFLGAKIEEDPQGFVALDVLLTFNKLKSLSTDKELIAAALESSDDLELNQDNSSVRRKIPFDKNSTDDSDARSLYVENLPSELQVDEIMTAFAAYAPKMASVIRDKEKNCRGYAFLELGSAELLEKAVKELPAKDLATRYDTIVGDKFDMATIRVLPKAAWVANKDKKDKKRKKPEDDDIEEEKSSEPAFVPDSMVELSNLGVGDDVRAIGIKIMINQIQPGTIKVKFVDILEDATKARLRFGTTEETQAFLTHVTEKKLSIGGNEVSARLLSEEEQKVCWEDAKQKMAEASSRGNNKGFRGGRGRGRGRGSKRGRR